MIARGRPGLANAVREAWRIFRAGFWPLSLLCLLPSLIGIVATALATSGEGTLAPVFARALANITPLACSFFSWSVCIAIFRQLDRDEKPSLVNAWQTVPWRACVMTALALAVFYVV